MSNVQDKEFPIGIQAKRNRGVVTRRVVGRSINCERVGFARVVRAGGVDGLVPGCWRVEDVKRPAGEYVNRW